MTRYADKVPQEDKQKILDLYYGRNGTKLSEALDRWQIAQRMGNKYSPAQIYSIIIDDMNKGADNE